MTVKTLIALPLMLLVVAGCSQRAVSNTARTPIEQLLLSGATDRALAKLELPEIAGKKVFVDLANLKSYDVEYVRVATRARFAQLGGILVAKPEDADYVAEVACGALAIEFKSSVVGIPSLPVPNSPIGLPEVNAYRTTEQTGIMKLLIFVHAKGELILAAHYYAKCDREEGFVGHWRFQRTDEVREGWEESDRKIQAKRDKAKAKEKAKVETVAKQAPPAPKL